MKRFFAAVGAVVAASLIGGSASNAHAASGADILLQSSAPTSPPGSPAASNPLLGASAGLGEIKLSDPFAMQLFSRWQSEKDLPYEVNQWVLKILRQDYAGAAHLWTALEPKFSDSFRSTAKAAQIYCFWKLGLAQTFFDQFVMAMGNPEFSALPAVQGLRDVVSPGFDQWLVSNAITLAPEHLPIIEKMDPAKSWIELTLRAWISTRKGSAALAFLEKLPDGHEFKIPLAMTVALDLAKKSDLAGSGKVLKLYMEPAIAAKKDPLKLSAYYLQLGRLLYQAGALDAAEEFYARIPDRAPEFLAAREEMTWVLLRKGDNSKLRGELATLTSKLYANRFVPESFVVRAISNLKFCYYENVQKDLDAFIQNNQNWAKEIEGALKAAGATPPRPQDPDFYAVWAERGIESRNAESKKLEALGQASIEAALPAVGIQAHWSAAKDRMVVFAEMASKDRAREYGRQWKNKRAMLTEAIRKMKFIKVELLNQVHELAQNAPVVSTQDAVKTSAAAPKSAPQAQEGEIVFPVSGGLWPDEYFRLRSTAQSKCLERMAQR